MIVFLLSFKLLEIRYVNQPETNATHHTIEFMNGGYHEGFKGSAALCNTAELTRARTDKSSNEPIKYSSLIYYNNMSSTTDSRDYYHMEYYTAMLVQEAEKLYNKLVNEITRGITYDAAFSSSISPSLIWICLSDFWRHYIHLRTGVF